MKNPLGLKTTYPAQYDPEQLFAIARSKQRAELNLANMPFFGVDLWNHYEVSWLNAKGKPQVGLAKITYDCHSPYLIESKSLKLYFNSFNNTQFVDKENLQYCIQEDIAKRICAPVDVQIFALRQFVNEPLSSSLPGISLDEQDISDFVYTVTPQLLEIEEGITEEMVYSDLLRSNCLITQQPDWASVQIAYRGRKINHASLLRYIISYRDHHEFAEHCIERIFADLMQYCQPEMLTVYGRYTRRGGIDINPLRSTHSSFQLINDRLARQ